jgi:hypothetical protein
MYVIPAPGLKVPDPARFNTPEDHLPPEGREVEPSGYWTRRLMEGGVTLGEPPAASPPVAA